MTRAGVDHHDVAFGCDCILSNHNLSHFNGPVVLIFGEWGPFEIVIGPSELLLIRVPQVNLSHVESTDRKEETENGFHVEGAEVMHVGDLLDDGFQAD